MDYLGDYLGKNVEIVSKSGKIWRGHVSLYEPANDSDEDEPEDAIAILLHPNDNKLIEFYASEIKSVKIIN